MTGSAIDRQVFELDCSSEGTAWAIQKQLIYYTAPVLEDILGAVLEELEEEGAGLRIDRLEIDLGSIRKLDFGGPEMLEKFRSICKEQLGRAFDRLAGESEPPVGAAMDADWEMTRNFLLDGDLPWWADKSLLPDMDNLLWRALDKHPDRIAAFFGGEGRSMEVVRRIRWQYKPGTLEMLGKIVPAAGSLLRSVLGSMLRSGMRWVDEAGWSDGADRVRRTAAGDPAGLPGRAGAAEFRDKVDPADRIDRPGADGLAGGSGSVGVAGGTGAAGARVMGETEFLRAAVNSNAVNTGSGAGVGVVGHGGSGVSAGSGAGVAAGAGSGSGGVGGMRSGKGADDEGSATGEVGWAAGKSEVKEDWPGAAESELMERIAAIL
ncbi:MAG TPA: contractile injection system tape measure protein, partial [Puia sp.]|nr:contractile injection system tape measure protein [Puia sp.]